MPVMSDGPSERRVVSGAHAGAQTPDQPGPTGGQGTTGRKGGGCRDGVAGGHGRPAGGRSKECGEDRSARVQDHQDSRPADQAVGIALSATVPRDHAGRDAPGAFHVRLRTEGR